MSFGNDIFEMKYRHEPLCTSWPDLANCLADSVCGGLLPRVTVRAIADRILSKKFIPAGRYLYYAGRSTPFYNNCFALGVEDTRQGWASLAYKLTSALMIGGGCGVVYSDIRPSGSRLTRTGGVASGPIPLMKMANEIGRNVMQGGSRRSALWAGLRWDHPDLEEFLTLKDWPLYVQEQKALDYNFPATLDMTNISVLFDDAGVASNKGISVLRQVVEHACVTGEPGICFNLRDKGEEVYRNACCEFISDRPNDVCNLGAVNMAAHDKITDFDDTLELASQFLMCGSVRSELPFEAVRVTRDVSRKIGLGLMGVHEWLIKRATDQSRSYRSTTEFEQWMQHYHFVTDWAASCAASTLNISKPVRTRAIAPTGTISIIAGTTSGIEPLFAAAVKRRYLVEGHLWKETYFIDPAAKRIAQETGFHPDDLQTAYDLAVNPEDRVKFQALIQNYVDMGISSTVNLPQWGSQHNNDATTYELFNTIKHHAQALRGITMYPDGARAGQTLTKVSYDEAVSREGQVFDASEEQCRGGVCGI